MQAPLRRGFRCSLPESAMSPPRRRISRNAHGADDRHGPSVRRSGRRQQTKAVGRHAMPVVPRPVGGAVRHRDYPGDGRAAHRSLRCAAEPYRRRSSTASPASSATAWPTCWPRSVGRAPWIRTGVVGMSSRISMWPNSPGVRADLSAGSRSPQGRGSHAGSWFRIVGNGCW